MEPVNEQEEARSAVLAEHELHRAEHIVAQAASTDNVKSATEVNRAVAFLRRAQAVTMLMWSIVGSIIVLAFTIYGLAWLEAH